MNALICLLATGLGAPPADSLQCPEPIAAKGEVKSGPALVHTFELTNRGNGTVTITRVDASCGCLRRSLSRDVLKPAETAKLALEVNTLTQAAGPNRWQVTVGYKVEAPGVRPEPGELVLEMTATLSQEVMVSPPQLAFSTAAGAAQTLTVTDLRAAPLTVIKAATTSPHLVAELGVQTQRPQGGYRQDVIIKLSADAPIGRTEETVVLTTNDPAYPELRVSVQIEKRTAGGIAVTPDAVTVRFGAEPAEVATLVQLRRADGKPLRIADAVSDNPGVTVKWSKGAGALATVRVAVAETLAAQAGSCTVRVKLEDSASPEIAIPVKWQGTKKDN